jgi:hypothetical protein
LYIFAIFLPPYDGVACPDVDPPAADVADDEDDEEEEGHSENLRTVVAAGFLMIGALLCSVWRRRIHSSALHMRTRVKGGGREGQTVPEAMSSGSGLGR